MSPVADSRTDGTVSTFRQRYRLHFERWAYGRLPAWALAPIDIPALVADTFDELDVDRDASVEDDGPLLDLVRGALYWKLLHGLRLAAREILIQAATLTDKLPMRDLPADDDLIERYEDGLKRLPACERCAIVARTELGLPWPQVSQVVGGGGDKSVRLAVCLALVHLAREMSDEHIA